MITSVGSVVYQDGYSCHLWARVTGAVACDIYGDGPVNFACLRGRNKFPSFLALVFALSILPDIPFFFFLFFFGISRAAGLWIEVVISRGWGGRIVSTGAGGGGGV